MLGVGDLARLEQDPTYFGSIAQSGPRCLQQRGALASNTNLPSSLGKTVKVSGLALD